MRRLALVALLVAGLSASAEALTIKDVIELTRAGLGDDVLLALIEVDGGVYAIDSGTLKSLKEAGVSERVIVALIRSGRQQRLAPEPPPVVDPVQETAVTPPPPQVVVIEHHEPAQVREVMVPVPVYVPVPTRRPRTQDVIHTTETTYVPFQSGMPVERPAVDRRSEPSNTYWGFGGRLRSDAWGQPRERESNRGGADRPSDKPADKPRDRK